MRNKWLRILETTGGRAGNMTGASSVRHTPSADSASASGSYNSAASRGRGRGRGAQRGRGGRGGSRVIPRQPAPPAMVGVPLCIVCYLDLAFNIRYNILGPSTRTRVATNLWCRILKLMLMLPTRRGSRILDPNLSPG